MNFTASHLIFVIFLAGQTLINNVVAQRKRQNEYQQILSKFNSWKEKQFRSGTYASEKNCNPDTMLKKGYKGPEMGIPKELTMSFFDLNNDKIIDGLVTFSVDQCDGGNALMNLQTKLLILSKADSYFVDDKYFTKIESALKKGWITIESSTYGTIYGTFHDYKEADGRCCPSITKPFSLTYPTTKLNYEIENIIFYKK